MRKGQRPPEEARASGEAVGRGDASPAQRLYLALELVTGFLRNAEEADALVTDSVGESLVQLLLIVLRHACSSRPLYFRWKVQATVTGKEEQATA